VKNHLFDHSAIFGFSSTDADRPVAPGDIPNYASVIATTSQIVASISTATAAQHVRDP
jgi:hypothetical protein